jgi:hypothetical protein
MDSSKHNIRESPFHKFSGMNVNMINDDMKIDQNPTQLVFLSFSKEYFNLLQVMQFDK